MGQVKTDYATALADWVRTNLTPEDLAKGELRHHHLGAALAEAVLQAHTNYAKVVAPRIEQFKAQHPEAGVLSGFLAMANRDDLQEALRWRGRSKIRRLIELAQALPPDQVETEYDLGAWLAVEDNRLKLRTIPGIGPKTVDYLALLTGHDAVAVDVHLARLIERVVGAGLSYEEARSLFVRVADSVGCSVAALDWAVWRHLSAEGNGGRRLPTGSLPGTLTGRLGAHLEELFAGAPNVEVYYDHSSHTRHRIRLYASEWGFSNATTLADVDLLIIIDGKPSIIIEVEERPSVPKKVLGDLVAPLLADRIRVPERQARGGDPDMPLEGTHLILAQRMKGEGAGPAKTEMVARMTERVRAALSMERPARITGCHLVPWRTDEELRVGISETVQRLVEKGRQVSFTVTN